MATSKEPMNMGLQLHMARQALKREGIPPDTVDLQAHMDSTLHLDENLNELSEKVGVTLYADSLDDYVQEYEYRLEDLDEQDPQKLIGKPTPNGTEPHNGHTQPEQDPPPMDPPPEDIEAPDEADEEDTPILVEVGEGPPREGVVDKVMTLAERDPIRDTLTAIVEREEEAVRGDHGEYEADLGWEPDKIPVPPKHVRQLKNQALLKVTYDSNQYTNYALVHRPSVKEGLERVKNPQNRDPTFEGRGVDLEAFRSVAESGDALEELLPRVAPQVEGMPRVKKAALISLASLDDAGGTRGRVHTLMYGPPGTAKTKILMWASRVAQVEVFSPRVTEAGLTVDMRDGSMGALPRAHNTEFSAFIIDEIEEADRGDIQHTLQALEEGVFTVTGADVKETFPAEVRFLGACNDPEKLSPEFRDRQDFYIEVDHPGREEGKDIVSTIVHTFREEGGEDHDAWIRNYLRWVRDYEPPFPADERALAETLCRELVDLHGDDAVRIRPYESILRVAYTLARLNRGTVNGERVLEAIELLQPDLNSGKLGSLRKTLRLKRQGGT